MSWRCAGASPRYKKALGASPQYISTDFQARGNFATGHFRLLSSSPQWGRELIFREAVLPLMYRVKEDGLQTENASATHPSWVCPMACRRKPSMGIFGMSEPNTTCPHCKAEIASLKHLPLRLSRRYTRRLLKENAKSLDAKARSRANALNSPEPLNERNNSSLPDSRLSERSQQKRRRRLSFQSSKANHRKLLTYDGSSKNAKPN